MRYRERNAVLKYFSGWILSKKDAESQIHGNCVSM